MTKGSVALKPREMKEIRTQLQMVFQDPYSSLNPRKHIYEILAQPMLYHHIATRATVGKELERILDMVGLSRNVLGRYPHEFFRRPEAENRNCKGIVLKSPVPGL